MRMDQSTHFTESQKVAIDKMTASVGLNFFEFLAVKGPDVLNARVDTFMQDETTLLGQVQNN